uniref:Uncharacterized protein n=1 Tax=Rhizophora mucronata TaxID=61149 RepID=A0A2P2N9J8_RHIMU
MTVNFRNCENNFSLKEVVECTFFG